MATRHPRIRAHQRGGHEHDPRDRAASRTSPTARCSCRSATPTLLTTVVTSKPREGIDFFPLTVDVEERMYAAGKIPGSFFRREGRPGEQAILTCRLTDRPLRPSFPEGFRNEVQVIATILGADLENPHDVASINGASAALTVSGIPFDGPIGAVRLAQVEGEWIAHPTFEQSDESTFEMVVAGRMIDDGDIAIMMVEAGGTEATWQLYEDGAPKVTEDVIADGLEEAKQWINGVDRPPERARAEGPGGQRPDRGRSPTSRLDYHPDVFDAVAEQATRRARRRRWQIADKHERNTRLDEILEGRDRHAGRQRRRARRVRRSRRRGQAGVPLAAEAGGAQPHRQRGRAASTVAARPTSARSRPRSASSPPRTARASSSGARPRC